MAFTSISDLLNTATGGAGRLHVGGKSTTKDGVGLGYSLEYAMWADAWTYDGRTPNGVVPSSAAAPTAATQGAIEFVNATALHTKYLTDFTLLTVGTHASQAVLYDRLLHIGGLSGTVTTAQTVGGTLTRNTGGEGNEIWIVCYASTGTTPQTLTASYTNQAGTAGRTTEALPWPPRGYNFDATVRALPLQAGDTGVRSVQSVTLSGSTGGAGDFGVVIAKPIAVAASGNSVIQGSMGKFSAMQDTRTPIPLEDDTCLAVAFSSANTTEQNLDFALHMIERPD